MAAGPHIYIYIYIEREREREKRKKVGGGSERHYIRGGGDKKLYLRFLRFPGSARLSFWYR
jgi:hypothetical protein